MPAAAGFGVKDIGKIIQGCLKNDRKSQFLLYDYCFDCMMSICLRYEKDRDLAMEILNAAFIKVLKTLNSYDASCPLKPWVRRITLNEAIDSFRKKQRRREVFEQDGEPEYGRQMQMPGSEHWVESQYLQHLLHSLKENEKVVFNLFAIDGYSHKEIGEFLGITERSSIRHLTNARRKLQDQLAASEMRIKKA